MKRVNLTNYGDRRILLTELVLVLILVVLTVFLLGSVNDIQGTAKVVNYTGIVRGGTQRLVKLELCGQPNDELLEELDAIIEELYHGGGKHNFAQLDSQEYKDQLYAIDHYWHGLREEILYARKNAGEQSELLSMSETYFDMTNTLVEKAEQFSQEEATQIRWMEFFILFDIAAILFLLAKQTIKAVKLGNSNKELNKTAYIDIHTGLPNKSGCERILSRREEITVSTCCMMFDLNDLKYVNDTLGHIAGDSLILNFAHLLRRIIPQEHFLGRYGGDEFVAVIENTTHDEIEFMLDRIRAEINKFNNEGRQVQISFACGYALSTDYQECTLEVLLGKADYNMYRNKEAIKNNKKSSF